MKNNIKVVQASLLGSVLVNLLLVLGSAIIAGGVISPDQTYNNDVTHSFVGLLNLTVSCLMIPVSFFFFFLTFNISKSQRGRVSANILIECFLWECQKRQVRRPHGFEFQQRSLNHSLNHLFPLFVFPIPESSAYLQIQIVGIPCGTQPS